MVAVARFSSPELVTDGELVASLRSGDLGALGPLFDRHGANIRRLFLRCGVRERDVDDLVQDAFIDTIGASSTFCDGHSVRAWLLGVTRIVLLRHRRSVACALGRAQRWAALHVDPRVTTPFEELEWTEGARRGQRALSALPPKKRDAFVLVVLEGLTGEEAAATLEVPIATVWTRVHYARRQMSRLLALDPP